MTTRAPHIALLQLFAACSGAGGSTALPDASLSATTIQSTLATQEELRVHAGGWFDGGVVENEDQLLYALSDAYPREYTVRASDAGWVYFGLSDPCRIAVGTPRLSEVRAIEGTAASLSLDDGALRVSLNHEGESKALVAGALDELRCYHDAGVASSLPLRQWLTIKVAKVAGFKVWHDDCAPRVLPADTQLGFPPVWPVDATGERLAFPVNVVQPVTMTIVAEHGATADAGLIAYREGRAWLKLDTTLPVTGETALELVGPSAVTAIEPAWVLLADSKGPDVYRIDAGATYPVFPSSTVWQSYAWLESKATRTERGRLCAPAPPHWFRHESKTPATCTTDGGAALIVKNGACELEGWLVGERGAARREVQDQVADAMKRLAHWGQWGLGVESEASAHQPLPIPLAAKGPGSRIGLSNRCQTRTRGVFVLYNNTFTPRDALSSLSWSRAR